VAISGYEFLRHRQVVICTHVRWRTFLVRTNHHGRGRYILYMLQTPSNEATVAVIFRLSDGFRGSLSPQGFEPLTHDTQKIRFSTVKGETKMACNSSRPSCRVSHRFGKSLRAPIDG
jgi:hypothetical protein